MEKLKNSYRSPLLKDGRIRRGWEEVLMGPDKLDSLYPWKTSGLRLADQPPRHGEVHVGIHPVRIFRKVA